jgi:hypothetical protein
MPLCPRCQNNFYVRVEWVLSGRRVSGFYYCGHCHHEWQVDEAPAAVAPERRLTERRRHARGPVKRRP